MRTFRTTATEESAIRNVREGMPFNRAGIITGTLTGSQVNGTGVPAAGGAAVAITDNLSVAYTNLGASGIFSGQVYNSVTTATSANTLYNIFGTPGRFYDIDLSVYPTADCEISVKEAPFQSTPNADAATIPYRLRANETFRLKVRASAKDFTQLVLSNLLGGGVNNQTPLKVLVTATGWDLTDDKTYQRPMKTYWLGHSIVYGRTLENVLPYSADDILTFKTHNDWVRKGYNQRLVVKAQDGAQLPKIAGLFRTRKSDIADVAIGYVMCLVNDAVLMTGGNNNTLLQGIEDNIRVILDGWLTAHPKAPLVWVGENPMSEVGLEAKTELARQRAASVVASYNHPLLRYVSCQGSFPATDPTHYAPQDAANNKIHPSVKGNLAMWTNTLKPFHEQTTNPLRPYAG